MIWNDGYDGTHWISNGVFDVAGAFEDAERLVGLHRDYVSARADWDEMIAIGDGLGSPHEVTAQAQRLQNPFDGKLERLVEVLAEALEFARVHAPSDCD